MKVPARSQNLREDPARRMPATGGNQEK